MVISFRSAMAAAAASLVVVGSSAWSPAGAETPPQQAEAQATLLNVEGVSGGVVKLTQEGGGTRVEVTATGLSPGWHGMHVHAVGDCSVGDPATPFTAAGGHLGAPEAHGTDAHDGDLPPLWVNADGVGHAMVRTDNLRVSQLLDADGSAVIIHAARDNQAHIPADRYRHAPYDETAVGPDAATRNTGDAGGRQRCGTVHAGGQDAAGGYWLVAEDGGVFTFGSAPFHGAGAPPAGDAVVDMEATPSADGYWVATRGGHVQGHGAAVHQGSAAGIRLQAPVIGIAVPPGATAASLADASGVSGGVVKLTQEGGGTRVEVTATGLSPGWHGMHVHAVGDCSVGDPATPFTAAGGHLGAPEAHGTDAHDGDLPPLWVNADGVGHAMVRTDNLRVSQLLDADGSAVIIHAARDNQAHIPADRYRHAPYDETAVGPDAATRNTGDAGGRQRCGTVRPTGGYWLGAADGGVFAYGGVGFHGSAAGLPLRSPVVDIEASPSGRGYWLAAADGGVFTYGDASFHGAAARLALRQPVIAIAATPSGAGYWLVASDGGVFTYGDATYHGSTGDLPLRAPITSTVPTDTAGGYWLIAEDGGVFAFGDARFEGSRSDQRPHPVVDAAGS